MKKYKKPDFTKYVVAQAVVQAGYGTDSYNSETNECTHACYASFLQIYVGYWDEYDISTSAMDSALNLDFNLGFNLGFNFSVYLICKWSDGSKSAKEVEWDFKNNCIADPDLLGLEADTKELSISLDDWKLISRLNLPRYQVERCYGKIPKEALEWF